MAGRIPQGFIDDILVRTDIVELVDARVPLKKAGRNYSACCPFHNEKTPSFMINPDKQFYHCFGCGVSGSALGFLMEYEHLSFPEAVEELARGLGLEVPHEGGSSAPTHRSSDALYQVMQQAGQYYREQLRQHPCKQVVVDYLKGRGLSGEIAAEYGMGYAPPGYENLLRVLENDLAKRSELEQQLVKTGMLIRNDRGGSYDRFRDRVMFPIRDQRGRCIAFGGRVLEGDDAQGRANAAGARTAGAASPKYLNSPETPLFHKGRELYGLYEMRRALRQIDRVLVVEGYMDVVALAQFDIRYAVATLGTATTADHLQRLFRLSHEIVFCFDGDRAGREAAWRALNNALPVMREGLQVRFMFLPDGEDPDSFVRQLGKNQFEQAVSEARSFSDYFFATLCESLNLQNIDGRAELVEHARPLLGQLLPGVYRQMMLKQLADLARMELAELDAAIQDRSVTNKATRVPASAPHAYNRLPGRTTQSAKSSRSPVRTAIMRLLTRPELASKVENPENLHELDVPGIEILCQLVELLHAHPHLKCGAILEHWREDANYPHLKRLAEWQSEVNDEASIEAEFVGAIDRLTAMIREHRLEHLMTKSNSGQLSEAEKQEFKELTQLI